MFGRKRPKQPKSLLDAIDEEVVEARVGTPTGAIPIQTDIAKKRVEPLREIVVIEARKPRTLVLLVLLLAVVLELAVVKWTSDASETIEQQHASMLPAEQPRPAGSTGPAQLAQPGDAGPAGDAGAPRDAGTPADAGEAAAADEPPEQGARQQGRPRRKDP